MDDLISFAKARLDEDEAAAREAHPGPWTLDEWTGGFGRMASVMMPFGHGAPDAKTGLTALAKLGTQDYETSRHIARHDPARVLREVEAGRRILARYQDCLARMEDPDYPQAAARDQAREYEDFVLPNLLVQWADHPDYRQEWAP